jgi:hypothetical protein
MHSRKTRFRGAGTQISAEKVFPAPGVPGRRKTQNEIKVFYICENQRNLRETLFWYRVKRHAERSEASRRCSMRYVRRMNEFHHPPFTFLLPGYRVDVTLNAVKRLNNALLNRQFISMGICGKLTARPS